VKTGCRFSAALVRDNVVFAAAVAFNVLMILAVIAGGRSLEAWLIACWIVGDAVLSVVGLFVNDSHMT